MDLDDIKESDMVVRAAWLSFIGGYTQEEIATRMGVSRIKVNRLISQARKNNMVHFFIDGLPAKLIELEDKISKHYRLSACHVCMALGRNEEIESVGNAGAKILNEYLTRKEVKTIGLGNGRTIAAIVSALPVTQIKNKVNFVSLSGSLMRSASANPFDMIYKICEKTRGEGYFMPAPFVTDTVKDKKVIMQQSSLKKVLKIAENADLLIYGLGNLSKNSFIYQTGLITDQEFSALSKSRAVAEILGNFLDKNGNIIDIDINQRTVGVNLKNLSGKTSYIAAAGVGKTDALHAVLCASIPSGIIIDETLARSLITKFINVT